MARNQDTYPKITLNGKVSSRANTRDMTTKSGDPFTKTAFVVTEGDKTRINRQDKEYTVAPKWEFVTLGGDDSDQETRDLLAIIGDLEIGDNVEVEFGVSPKRYGDGTFVVFNVRNSAQ